MKTRRIVVQVVAFAFQNIRLFGEMSLIDNVKIAFTKDIKYNLVKEVFSIIEDMHKEGIAILLVEQNTKMALSVADRFYMLENGRIAMSGTAHDLLDDERVRRAYLGA